MERGWIVCGCAWMIACTTPDADGYRATIRWTEHGIPHIVGETFGDMAYGHGYAFARDHACVLAEQIVRVHGERARWFGEGPDGRYRDQDFGWRSMRIEEGSQRMWDTLDPKVLEVVQGYTAGYNRYITEETLSPLCADAPWVRPIEPRELVTFLYALGLDGSSVALLDFLGTAQPPSGQSPPPPRPASELPDLRAPGRGSNGWAFGRDLSASGGGMLLSNTHFPGYGVKQWHEAHLTVPGELNVYGASLLGVPAINIGFNEHVAWTHTVSFVPRFTFYLLELDPADPTRYRLGDDYVSMESEEHEVQILQDDGSVTTWTRTLYWSHLGPMLDSPGVGWNNAVAVTYRDVSAENYQLADAWFGMNKATDKESFIDAHASTQAVPWVYTLMADAEGSAVFLESSRTPYVDDAAYDDWEAEAERNFVIGTFAEFGLIVQDGSDPGTDWRIDDRAATPGIVPFEEAPMLERDDYVFNANDAHWWSNLDEPLDDYLQVYGDDRWYLTRSRANGSLLAGSGPDSMYGEDGKLQLDELEQTAMDGHSKMAQVLVPEVVARCEATSSVEVGGEVVDLTEACAVLAGWNGSYGLDAVGAVLWRETLGGGQFDLGGLQDAGDVFAEGFDPAAPVETPRGLVPAPDDGPDPWLVAMAEAVQRLEGVGIAPDARLGDVQFMPLGEERFPVPGSLEWEGSIAISGWLGSSSPLPLPGERGEVVHEQTQLTVDGYAVNEGNSWIMAMSFEEDGPEARAVMVYSQSDDPTSPYFSDQSEVYAAGALRQVRFTEEDIEASPALEVLELVQD